VAAIIEVQQNAISVAVFHTPYLEIARTRVTITIEDEYEPEGSSITLALLALRELSRSFGTYP
jgi:hypothetical protein